MVTTNKPLCKRCNGLGITQTQTSAGVRLDPCKCREKEIFQKRLEYAHIPKKFRNWNLRKLTKSFRVINSDAFSMIKAYTENIDRNIRKGRGLWFSAPPGTAKSSIMCSILKSAMREGYAAYYIRAHDLQQLKMDSLRDRSAKQEVNRILEDIQILAIDDLEQVYLNGNWENFVNTLFFGLLSDLDASNISLLVSSNDTRDNVLQKYPPYIGAQLAKLKDVIFRYTPQKRG